MIRLGFRRIMRFVVTIQRCVSVGSFCCFRSFEARGLKQHQHTCQDVICDRGYAWILRRSPRALYCCWGSADVVNKPDLCERMIVYVRAASEVAIDNARTVEHRSFSIDHRPNIQLSGCKRLLVVGGRSVECRMFIRVMEMRKRLRGVDEDVFPAKVYDLAGRLVAITSTFK